MEKKKIKILLVGELSDGYELFSANLLDFDKIELLNVVDLEDATNMYFANLDIDIIMFSKFAFENLSDLECMGNYGFEEYVEMNNFAFEDLEDGFEEITNQYIDENPEFITLEEVRLDENELKRALPKFINLLRSFGFSGIILASTNIPDIASKFLKAGCSGSVTSIYGAHTLIDKMYLQKNNTSSV